MSKYLLTIIVMLLTVAYGCSHYSRGSWMGKVIDAETKQPIEGAAVLAAWKEDYSVPPDGGTALVDVVETQTDSEGNFKIPAKSYVAIRPEGKVYGPLFRIFKPSYKFFKYGETGFVVDSEEWHVYPDDWKGRFEKPDAVVELLRLKKPEERVKNLPDSSPFGVNTDQNKIKYYIHLLNTENIELGFKPYPEPQ